MMAEDNDSLPPTPTSLYITRLIPHEETVSWKVHDVSTLLKTQAWTSMSIPLQVGVGATELSKWIISLQTRNNNSVLCARAMLISPNEQHRRVTHHLKVAVESGDDQGPIYYFPAASATTTSATNNDSNNPTNSNNPNNTSTNANLTTTNNTNTRNRGSRGRDGGNNDNTARCSSMRRALRRFFVKNAKIDGDEDDLIGDGRLTKEARPAHKAPQSLWKIVPIDKIRPGENDCIELRVTLTVLGCDVEEKRI